jgi:hypothetical protein
MAVYVALKPWKIGNRADSAEADDYIIQLEGCEEMLQLMLPSGPRKLPKQSTKGHQS